MRLGNIGGSCHSSTQSRQGDTSTMKVTAPLWLAEQFAGPSALPPPLHPSPPHWGTSALRAASSKETLSVKCLQLVRHHWLIARIIASNRLPSESFTLDLITYFSKCLQLTGKCAILLAKLIANYCLIAGLFCLWQNVSC